MAETFVRDEARNLSAGNEAEQTRRRRYRAPPFLPIWAVIGSTAVVILIGTYPYYGSNAYVLSLLGKCLCFAIFSLSIDLSWGFTGILSLGQAVYFGIGAYLVALSLKINYALTHPTRYGANSPILWNGTA
jgi:ABC-type branched-subunit amino acid transport system permease subunit